MIKRLLLLSLCVVACEMPLDVPRMPEVNIDQIIHYSIEGVQYKTISGSVTCHRVPDADCIAIDADMFGYDVSGYVVSGGTVTVRGQKHKALHSFAFIGNEAYINIKGLQLSDGEVVTFSIIIKERL